MVGPTARQTTVLFSASQRAKRRRRAAEKTAQNARAEQGRFFAEFKSGGKEFKKGGTQSVPPFLWSDRLLAKQLRSGTKEMYGRDMSGIAQVKKFLISIDFPDGL
jgi:hypothetical protein